MTPSFCFFLLACTRLHPAPCCFFFQEKGHKEKEEKEDSKEGKDKGEEKSEENIDNMETMLYMPDTQDMFEGGLEEEEKNPDNEGSESDFPESVSDSEDAEGARQV